MKQCLLSAGILILALLGCTREPFERKSNEDVFSVRVIGPKDIVFEEEATRGTVISGNTLLFSWALDDSLGIFPDQGNQVEFPITELGETSAHFNGGGWGLKSGSSYAAYYPFSVWNYHRNRETILLDYSGQVQDGNGSFAHLSAYDYLASSRLTAVNGTVTFQMSRLGAILYIDMVVPDPSTLNSLVISCDEAIFTEKAELDLSGADPLIKSKKKTNALTLTFENITTTEPNEPIRAYMAVSPVDFSEYTVSATLYTENDRFGAPVVSRKVEQGKAAYLRFSEDFTPPYVEMAPGIFWAKMNVGSTKPSDPGDYFAWGETEPKDNYTWGTYRYGYYWNQLTKYVTDTEDPEISYGTIDNKTILEAEDDAATVNWGEQWRSPTVADWTVLRDVANFDWVWTSDYYGTGVAGYTVTSKVQGCVGNQIFIPAAGMYSDRIYQVGSLGYYWSSEVTSELPYLAESLRMSENTRTINMPSHDERCNGLSIRPVKGTIPNLESVTNVEISKRALTLLVGETASLTATVLPENASINTVTWYGVTGHEDVATVSPSGVVTGVGVGKTYVYVQTVDGGFSDYCVVKVVSSSNTGNHDYVEMGDCLKWATMNVGASSVTDRGNYFAWGETEPISSDSWESYKYFVSDPHLNNYIVFSKYVTDSNFGTIDNKTVLESGDDAATVKWGGTWRTPTKEEWQTLLNTSKYDWEWTTDYNGTGIKGYIVTSKVQGYVGNRIFLRAGGAYNANTGTNGGYWSATLNNSSPRQAWEVGFNATSLNLFANDRCYGFTIRPVSD